MKWHIRVQNCTAAEVADLTASTTATAAGRHRLGTSRLPERNTPPRPAQITLCGSHARTTYATPRFRAGVLGPFTLERDGVKIDTSRWQRRVAALFKLLVTVPDRRRRRDDLIDILWPDADSDRGMVNLRMLVHRLRATIDLPNPPPVLSEAGWIALNPQCEWELDLEPLEAAATNPAADLHDLEDAAALYRGEPLTEERYEDWARAPRERALHAWRAICVRLGVQYMSRAEHISAGRWLERALEADPFDEDAFRRLLANFHAAGRSAEALRRYARLEILFLDELDMAPSPATRSLAESIRHGAEAAPCAAATAAGLGIALAAAHSPAN
jgi:DNA-binding SARP family transcriptional activator